MDEKDSSSCSRIRSKYIVKIQASLNKNNNENNNKRYDNQIGKVTMYNNNRSLPNYAIQYDETKRVPYLALQAHDQTDMQSCILKILKRENNCVKPHVTTTCLSFLAPLLQFTLSWV